MVVPERVARIWEGTRSGFGDFAFQDWIAVDPVTDGFGAPTPIGRGGALAGA